MGEFPDFLVLMANNPAIRQAVIDLFKNKEFADSVTSVIKNPDRSPFLISIGDMETVERLRRAGVRIEPSKGAGGATGFTRGTKKDEAIGAGMFLFPDRFPEKVRQDSLANNRMLQDALIHEIAHVLPVAKSRNVKDALGDPEPGSPRQSQSDIVRAENALRGLLGLPAKTFYGLVLEK